VAEDPSITQRKAAAVIHGLRNSAASVTLAIHSLQSSQEVASESGAFRLRIAKQEIDAIQHLLGELERLFSPAADPAPATLREP
jgi:hypothetical protein